MIDQKCETARTGRMNPRLRSYLMLHAVLLLYSVGGINSKLAATSPFLSTEFLVNYALLCIVSAVYAIVWQQVLKSLPLNTAYANKSVCIIWGFVWGSVIFHEEISVLMIAGSVLIVIGLLLMVSADDEH